MASDTVEADGHGMVRVRFLAPLLHARHNHQLKFRRLAPRQSGWHVAPNPTANVPTYSRVRRPSVVMSRGCGPANLIYRTAVTQAGPPGMNPPQDPPISLHALRQSQLPNIPSRGFQASTGGPWAKTSASATPLVAFHVAFWKARLPCRAL
ncbi:hypothetical protein LY76DRAFT_271586 [Colletotrichum caudatum]|nr:hypothetical protein LY76DRAFT_271586 [Colletotrichum caudatum]